MNYYQQLPIHNVMDCNLVLQLDRGIGMFISWFFINKLFGACSYFAFNCKEWSLSTFGWT